MMKVDCGSITIESANICGIKNGNNECENYGKMFLVLIVMRICE